MRGAASPPNRAIAFDIPNIMPLTSVGNDSDVMRKISAKQPIDPNRATVTAK